MPQQLTPGEVEAAIVAAIVEAGAVSMGAMGRGMAVLKGKYAGQMDFAAVGAVLKARPG